MAVGELIGAMGNFASNVASNVFANYRTAQDRKENYRYGEMAAENADRRTRALYEDYHSPQALLKQYKEAGLSPSLMFGGTPGQGGMTSGAQGTGATGIQTPFMPMSIVDAAQAAALFAQAKKSNAETKNIDTDTKIKEIEKELQGLSLQQFKDEWNILNTRWENDKGEQTSLFEMAEQYYTFESFLEDVRKDIATGKTNFKASTEAEIKTLRTIYENASRFNRDIAVLSQEQVSANFQLSVIQKLNEKGFQDLNADAAIAQLKQSIATNELTETQKNAWNNLINRLGKKGSTMRDIVVVLGMILGNFASHTGIKLNLGN